MCSLSPWLASRDADQSHGAMETSITAIAPDATYTVPTTYKASPIFEIHLQWGKVLMFLYQVALNHATDEWDGKKQKATIFLAFSLQASWLANQSYRTEPSETELYPGNKGGLCAGLTLCLF